MNEQSKWEREAGIFASFLDAAPDFAGAEIVDWKHNQNNSPDILCIDNSGNRIGVELTEWLNEEQTRDFARWEKLLSSVRIPEGWTVHLGLFPFGQHCEPSERPVIAEELSELIVQKVSRPRVKESGLLSFRAELFDLRSKAPTAARYCRWIAGFNLGPGRLCLSGSGSFGRAAPEAALRTVIEKKIQNKSYLAIRKQLKLRCLYLLVYYDVGIIKNTPNLDVNVPEVAASVISKMPTPFDGLFVLMFPGGDASTGRTVYRLGTEAHASRLELNASSLHNC